MGGIGAGLNRLTATVDNTTAILLDLEILEPIGVCGQFAAQCGSRLAVGLRNWAVLVALFPLRK